MTWWWSWLLTAVGVGGLYLAGRKNYYGWAIGMVAQVLWIGYATATHQWGFYISALAYFWVYAKNFLAWRRDAAPRFQVRSYTAHPDGRRQATGVGNVRVGHQFVHWGTPMAVTSVYWNDVEPTQWDAEDTESWVERNTIR